MLNLNSPPSEGKYVNLVPSAWSHVVPPPGRTTPGASCTMFSHPNADLERPVSLAPLKGVPVTHGRALPGTLPGHQSRKPQPVAIDLKARLYDKPETCQVLQAVKKRSSSKQMVEDGNAEDMALPKRVWYKK